MSGYVKLQTTAMKNPQNDNYGKNVREEHFQLEIIISSQK